MCLLRNILIKTQPIPMTRCAAGHPLDPFSSRVSCPTTSHQQWQYRDIKQTTIEFTLQEVETLWTGMALGQTV